MSCLSDGDPLQNSTYAHWKNGAPASYIFEKNIKIHLLHLQITAVSN